MRPPYLHTLGFCFGGSSQACLFQSRSCVCEVISQSQSVGSLMWAFDGTGGVPLMVMSDQPAGADGSSPTTSS